MYQLFDRVGNINFVVTAKVEGPVTASTLRAALAAVQVRHPLLNTCIEDGKFCPCRESIPLIETNDALTTVIENEMARNVKGPPMRCTWLPGAPHCLVLTFHHSASDATSGMNVVADLLMSASGKPLATRPLLPGIEALLPLNVRGLKGLFKVLRAYMEMYGYRLTLGRTRRLPIQTRVDWTEQTRRVFRRRLAPLMSQHLVERARSNNTTVHAALTAAFLLAISRSQNEPMTLCPVSMLGLRQYLKANVESDVGMFVSLVPTFHRVFPITPLWDVAREIKQRLQRSIQRGDALAALPPLRMLVPILSRFSENRLYQKLNNIFPAAITISNLGRLQLDENYNEFTLKEVDFAISPFADMAIAVAASTFAGCLTVNMSFIEPLVSRDFVEQLTDDALALLDVFLTSS